MTVTNVNEQLMKEILTYKDSLPKNQSDDHSISICLKDFGGQNKLMTTPASFP